HEYPPGRDLPARPRAAGQERAEEAVHRSGADHERRVAVALPLVAELDLRGQQEAGRVQAAELRHARHVECRRMVGGQLTCDQPFSPSPRRGWPDAWETICYDVSRSACRCSWVSRWWCTW